MIERMNEVCMRWNWLQTWQTVG